MTERQPHRSICSLCFHPLRVNFHVPDDIWELATHSAHRNSIICLDCFTRCADERSVVWDREITFMPVSRVTHDGWRHDGFPDGLLRGVTFTGASPPSPGVSRELPPDVERLLKSVASGANFIWISNDDQRSPRAEAKRLLALFSPAPEKGT